MQLIFSLFFKKIYFQFVNWEIKINIVGWYDIPEHLNKKLLVLEINMMIKRKLDTYLNTIVHVHGIVPNFSNIKETAS